MKKYAKSAARAKTAPFEAIFSKRLDVRLSPPAPSPHFYQFIHFTDNGNFSTQ